MGPRSRFCVYTRLALAVRRTYLNAWGRIVAKPALRRHYAALCTDVIINLNGPSKKAFHTFYSLAETNAAIADLTLALGVRAHVMSWVRPEPRWIGEMCLFIEGLSGISSVLLDLEEPWRAGTTREREVSAGAIADRMMGRPWGITDVPMVPRGIIDPMLQRARYAMPQCHTFGKRLIGKMPYYRRPGWLEPWTLANWRDRAPSVELIPHLAAYNTGTYRQTLEGLQTSVAACGESSAIAAWTESSGPVFPAYWKGWTYG